MSEPGNSHNASTFQIRQFHVNMFSVTITGYTFPSDPCKIWKQLAKLTTRRI